MCLLGCTAASVRLPIADPHPTPDPNLIAAVSFHFSARRLRHLEKTVKTLLEYPVLAQIYIVTNDATQTLAGLPSSLTGLSYVAIVVPPSSLLSDPHKLTWHHRSLFAEEFDKYKGRPGVKPAFMYLEDDIIIPYSTYLAWSDSADSLFTQHSLISSFVRVDGDPTAPSLGYLTDQFGNCGGEAWDAGQHGVEVKGKEYGQLWNPYAGERGGRDARAAENTRLRTRR